ncbi:MAG: putative carbon monoxide dehydrogenase large chain [Chloroflexi bacterium]|nr:MAG: putative carbon monoxide dehydrogenase large chain [Chloroflexota bacterium]MBA4376411.1 xanthine dehydrogenase [Anaerolinea sp.]
MTGKYFGQPIKRLEDKHLLSGRAKFIDDIEIPGMLHAAFLRSDYAHAIIKKIDVSEARKHPGVVAVYTAEDFGDYWKPGPLQVPPPTAIKGSQFNARTLVPIAKGKVRFSGEPVAIVIAESRYIAEDALEDIIFDAEPLPAVIDLEKAWEDTSVKVHDDLPSNLAALVKQEAGNYEEAKKQADVVVSRKLYADRVAGAAMENRGFVVNWDERNQEMVVWATTQAPLPLRIAIAGKMNLIENQVRVITPFIGGGFGPKIMTSQADDVLLPWISMKLNKPIKWLEDRRENFLATTSERDQVHYCEIALKKDGTILGFKDVFYHNTGAYDPYGMTVPLNTQTHTVSNYRIPNFYTEIRMVFTNEMVVTPVRGAGRPEGVFVMERMMDAAAKELKMDPAEIRMKNLLKPEEFPLKTGIIGQDFVEGVLDSGDYKGNLVKLLEMVEYEKFRKEIQPQARKEGKHLGIGVVAFTEGTAVGPYEGARVTIGNNGKVSVATGISTQGQGHFTVFAQIVAEQLNVKVEDVKVITGDTNHFHWGAGTFASRGATIAGTAIHNASVLVRQKIFATASKFLGVPEDQVELCEGSVCVKGKPEISISLGELAGKANPMRGAVEADVKPGLEATAYFAPPHGATGSGACAIIVDVDPETLKIKIDRLVLVHDCGTVINPLLLEGQIQGAISMGIGNAFYEKIVYDENGQLLTASFMDYLMPQATDMPNKMEIGHLHTSSPLNPLGMKGVGEAGAIPTPPAFVQAVEDALIEYNLDIADSNLNPSMIFEYMHRSKK